MSYPHQRGFQTPCPPTGAGGDRRSPADSPSSGLPSPIYHPDDTPPQDLYRYEASRNSSYPPQPVPRARARDVGVMQQPHGRPIQQDLASENARLREKIFQLEQKLQEKEKKMQEKGKEVSELDVQEYVQKFFEARVAVMGFKCRQMQLQGEVEYLRGKVNKPSETELQAQLEKMKAEKIAQDNELKSLRTVIDTLEKDIHELQGMSSQDHSEMQRLHQIARELQQENKALKSQQQQQPPSARAEQQHLWVVRREEIHLTPQEIGRGRWAVVQVAKFRGLPVAAKCLHLSQHNQHLLAREMNTASRLRHPNLVQFIGATIEGPLIILTELMQSSLRTVLEHGPLNPAQITFISIDVARALNYLHLMHPDPIIHRDITSTNVLLNSLPSNGWRAKVADYGSVNYLQHLKSTGPGNPTYAAPEADVPKLQSPKMDVFSYGVLLLEMCSQRIPAGVQERAACLHRVQQTAMRTLIQHCSEHDPQRRPDMSQILEHFDSH